MITKLNLHRGVSIENIDRKNKIVTDSNGADTSL